MVTSCLIRLNIVLDIPENSSPSILEAVFLHFFRSPSLVSMVTHCQTHIESPCNFHILLFCTVSSFIWYMICLSKEIYLWLIFFHKDGWSFSARHIWLGRKDSKLTLHFTLKGMPGSYFFASYGHYVNYFRILYPSRCQNNTTSHTLLIY